MEEAATPLPSEETTPPVTNIYFGAIRVSPRGDSPTTTGLLLPLRQTVGQFAAGGFQDFTCKP